MAIARDAISQSAGIGSTLSWTHTNGVGSNRILFVGITISGTSADVSGVTYAGAAMTGSIAGSSITGKFRTRLFYMVAPATGSNTVEVSFDSSPAAAAWASSYTGASQTGQPDAATSYDADPEGASSHTQSLSTVADNCWMILMATTESSAITPGTGASARGTDQTAGARHGLLMDSNSAITPAGSYSMTYSFGSSQATSLGIASFAPVAVAPPPPNIKVPDVLIFS